MNLLTLAVDDNISELLVKIIEFTQTRQKTLIRNINNIHSPGFVPKELPVEEFSELLQDAIDEHARSRRLILCDTETIKFGPNSSFKAGPIVDEYAQELLEEDLDEYMELQINKILENSLNQRLAAELLKQRQEAILTVL